MKLTDEQKDWQKRCPSHLKPKIEYSINLLRKAEKLALAYDSEDGYYLAFSGGKDSQVLYHIAELAGVKFKAHMNFTSVDPPQVVRFVRKQYPEVVTHAPKRSIYAAAVDRMILPTMRVRWCCAEFKEAAGAGKVTLIGIRKQESSRRAKRNEVEINSRKFSGTLEGLDTYRENKAAKAHDKHEQISIVNAKGERTLGCINSKESLLISPLLSWTDADVWTFLNDVVVVPHCELYDIGFSRVGCVLCPMSSRKVKAKMAQLYPEAKHRWIEAIKEIRRRGGYNKHHNALEQIDGEQSDQQKRGGQNVQRWLPLVEHASRPTSRTNAERAQNAQTAKSFPTPFQCSTSLQLGSTTPTIGFSDSSSTGGVVEGLTTEDEIAEAIFDWWISGKSYMQWYVQRYLQGSFNFDSDDPPQQSTQEEGPAT